MSKYSIITIASNGSLAETVRCIESIFKHTKDFELIVVDNATTDGTAGYLDALPHGNVKVVQGGGTFSKNNNLGLLVVDPDSEYIVFLNNDTIVHEGWIEGMEEYFHKTPFGNRVGAVGPVSSMSNGRQMVGVQDPKEWALKNKGRWSHTGILYGWCIMARRDVIDKIGGFDESFENGYEDNDLSLRIKLSGYEIIIAYGVYIDHVGQATLLKNWDVQTYKEKGKKNREVYYDKWDKILNNEPQKLVAVYRTNGGQWLERSLEQTSKFADSIIIHFCRAKENLTEGRLDKIIAKFPKIRKIEFYDGIFQEDYERNWLLQEALKLQALGQADWCISVDDDELYEDKFVDRVKSLMSPRNPEIMGYWCNWRTIWKSELGREFYRADSTFGSFTNYRFFRLIPGQQIMSSHPEGHHCGSAPWLSEENLQWCNIRVKHLGYDTPEQRQRKYEFYEANDNFKDPKDIGNEDYSHLISPNPILHEYHDNNKISCVMMVRDEEEYLLGCLEDVQYLVDEFVIIDTGSKDRTIEIIQNFKKHSPVPVIFDQIEWPDNYSIPRNYGKSLASGQWILHLDADERFAPHNMKDLLKLTENDTDLAIFHVLNYTEEPRKGITPKYASTQSIRLFRNIPDFYWSGILHETLDDALGANVGGHKIKGSQPDFPLHHYGYLKKKKVVRYKLDYYEKLNKRQIEVTGDTDPRPHFNLALHYMNDDRKVEAMKEFQRCLELADNKFWHASQQMASLNIDNAKKFLRQAAQTMPKNHQFQGQISKILSFLDQNTFGHTKVC